MVDPLHALSQAMNSDLFKMRSVSQNLSNVNTVAYKRSVPSIAPFEALITDNAQNPLAANPGVGKLLTDFKQGALKLTGDNRDLAIGSDAFFIAQGQQGEVYTRKGQTLVNAQGMLSLHSGEILLGRQGGIRVGADPYTVHSDGKIEQNEQIIDQLRLAKFINTDAVNYQGQGIFLAPKNAVEEITDVWDAGIAQGYLEASNVNTGDEMVRMIETTRHFESAANIIRGYDEMLDSAINSLADLNR